MQVQQRAGLEDDRGTNQPARSHEDCAQAGDHPIGKTEVGRTVSRPMEDQQLMRDEHRFGPYSTGAAGTGEPGNGRQQVQTQDDQVAHGQILPRSRHGQRMLANFGIRHAQAGNADAGQSHYGAKRSDGDRARGKGGTSN